MSGGEWTGWATILAIIIGPIIAVLITRWMDKAHAKNERKMDVFRTLMRTRNLTTSWDHVGALNLVEVEFAKHKDVVKAWKEYLNCLGEPFPPNEEKERQDKLDKKRVTLLTKLLDEIAKTLKIEIAQLDILAGNYVPQGWQDDHVDERIVRFLLMNVLSGKTSIKIDPYPHQPASAYPPPPEPTT